MYAFDPQISNTASPGLFLNGNCGYVIQNDRVVINIAEIANQRDFDNLSGTLAIELWALKQPYSGFDFNGVPLAGTTIGEISGQHYLAGCRYDLLFQEPPEGTWYLTLMLREWSDTGYVTRDYINFAMPYVVAGKPAVARNETDNVISVSFSEKKPLPTTTEKVKLETVEEKPAVPVSKKTQTDATTLSLNNASSHDIARVHGISKKLAETIVKNRPFNHFDELKKVKGVGPKLFQKIRHLFTL